MTSRPRAYPLPNPSARRGRATRVSRFSATDLMGASELFSSWPEHANQPLPCLALFFAQGAAQIGDHEQLVRQAAFAETCRDESPSVPLCRGTRSASMRGRFAFEALAQAQARGGAPEHALGRLIEQALTGAIDEAQSAVAVKCEHRDVDFLHHFAQQRGCFERAEALLRAASRRGHSLRAGLRRAHHRGWRRARESRSRLRAGRRADSKACAAGNTTRSASLNANPSHATTIKTVSVHWTFGANSRRSKAGAARRPCCRSPRSEGQQQDAALVRKRFQRLYFCRRR